MSFLGNVMSLLYLPSILRSDSSKTYSMVSLSGEANYRSQDSLRVVATNSICAVLQCFLGDVVS